MSEVSEESLLDYFYSTAGSSGKVRNADILKTFKPFIGHTDVQLRAKYREEFKVIIDRIAVVKSENGEKYLFLKKKYRQLLQARDKDKTDLPDVDGQRHLSSTAVPATAQWEVTDTSPRAPQQRECRDELISCSEPDSATELDPLEKEWIYFAAGARVPDLCQLLRQDPSLANKKTALHWAAKHGNEDMATLIANAGADVNTKSGYTPLHIAALHGHQKILDLLVGTYGAKENLRDYSGHLALQYLNPKEADAAEFQVSQARERNRNRKLASLFHSKKKWGSAEDLAPIEEERTTSHQLALPAFRPRKFSR
uniref:SOWAHA-C winged helix-turn-helix domain-containing protein n=1 Tax=Hippocampus comes TaxID=109280 RepID=A0A3Q2XQF0_HIPCM